MKKFFIIPTLILAMILCSCEMGGGNTAAKKITISYYDGTELIETIEYEKQIVLSFCPPIPFLMKVVVFFQRLATVAALAHRLKV